jgi:hypothetical protein
MHARTHACMSAWTHAGTQARMHAGQTTTIVSSLGRWDMTAELRWSMPSVCSLLHSNRHRLPLRLAKSRRHGPNRTKKFKPCVLFVRIFETMASAWHLHKTAQSWTESMARTNGSDRLYKPRPRPPPPTQCPMYTHTQTHTPTHTHKHTTDRILWRRCYFHRIMKKPHRCHQHKS